MASTLPPIQPHTVAKHHILEYHMKAWFPILGRSNRVLRYIDGFAGPGEYEGGEPGSPIVCLRAVKDHDFFDEYTIRGKSIEFQFVERNRTFFRHLDRKVKEERWPSNFHTQIIHGEFEEELSHLLDEHEARAEPMPPTLLFVDPFGSSGFPMELFRRLAYFDHVDVLINFNILEFPRFLPDRNKHEMANKLYGGDRWRPALNMRGRERDQFLAGEYQEALREIGWMTTNFEMVNSQNQPAYHLVFGTGSTKGLDVAKRAMRDASQTGTFQYSDRIDSAQRVLLGMEADQQYPLDVAECLFNNYEGQEVQYDLLLQEVVSMHPRWLESDLKAGLRFLEERKDPRISGVRYLDGRTRIKGTFPNGCRIMFEQIYKPEQGQLL